MSENYEDGSGWFKDFAIEWNKARAMVFGRERWKEQMKKESRRKKEAKFSDEEIIAELTRRLLS